MTRAGVDGTLVGMLPIFSESFPSTCAALSAAIGAGLAQHGITAQSVLVKGENFPALDELSVNLTGANFTRDFRLPKPAATESRSLTAVRLTLCGEPLKLEGAPVALRLEASDATLALAGEQETRHLILTGAAAGSVAISVAKSALESLLQAAAAVAAASKGIEVTKTSVVFTARGARSLDFQVEATAKIFVMRAVLLLRGNLAIDENLTARVSDLALGGDGMVVKMATGYAQPYFDRIQSRRFPLLTFLPAGLQLRDIEISTRQGIEIAASFGAG